MESQDLDALIAELEQLLPREPDRDMGPFWNKSREVQDGFRSGVRYKSKADRDRAWQRLNELRDAARAMAARRAEGSGWQHLDRAIDELRLLVDHSRSFFGKIADERLSHPLDHMLSFGAYVHDWRPVWELTRKIQEGFNAKPFYPTKSARDNAWVRFNDLRNEASELANKDREMRAYISQAWRDDIIRRAEDARYSKFWDSVEFLNPTTAEEMKRLGEVLRSAGQLLHENKFQMFNEHKEECFARIQEIRETHAEFWEQRHTAFNRRRVEHERRVDDVLVRIEANLDKNRERLHKSEEALSRADDHIDDLHEKIANAWNDAARDRFEGWLSEAENRRDSIQESIRRAEEWIAQDEERRNDIYRQRR